MPVIFMRLSLLEELWTDFELDEESLDGGQTLRQALTGLPHCELWASLRPFLSRAEFG